MVGVTLLSLTLWSSLGLALPTTPTFWARRVANGAYLDPSVDEWSSIISSVGPLIILVGKNTTKQVLRNVSGFSSAFSLATAPLGLISVITSLIRLCGVQRLRTFLGHGLEARNVAGLEVTRVNCGGVSAQLTDGYILRGATGNNPSSRLLAVQVLDETEWSSELEAQVLDRIQALREFEEKSSLLGIPDGQANKNWCLQIRTSDASPGSRQALMQVLGRTVGLDLSLDVSENVLDEAKGDMGETGGKSQISEITKVKVEAAVSSLQGENEGTGFTVKDIAFLMTFDAVSEFTSNGPGPLYVNPMIAIYSFSLIICIHLLEVWRNSWVITPELLLMLLGYLGIVLGVTLAALLIRSSCISVRLAPRDPDSCPSAGWKDGMVEFVKHIDSMDTTGCAFFSAPSASSNLEAVYLKPSTTHDKHFASMITALLIISFIAHYLGLRTLPWWTSVGELAVCIIAAFIRSWYTGEQPRFSEMANFKIDKRCLSTGVIRTQTARIIDETAVPMCGIDGRSYAVQTVNNTPTVAERVAYQTAKLALNDPSVRDVIIALTGMQTKVVPSTSSRTPDMRSVLVSFSGGILVTEGLASPACLMLLSFQSQLSNLAAPSGLLGRAILRQPEWCLQKGTLSDIPLGSVYIFAMQSLVDWWTMSEDRNDLGDLQRNLHWPMFLVNVAFFIQCLSMAQRDAELVFHLEAAHEHAGVADKKVAQDVIEYFRNLSP